MTDTNHLISQAAERAFKYEAQLGSCAQCVYAALMETFNIGDTETFRAADSLAGGTSLSAQGTCGALAGGMLIIGSLAGREYSAFKNDERKRRVFYYSKLLYDKFIAEYGSPLCKEVQKKIFGRSFNLLDKDDYAAFEQAGAHVDKCPGVSANMARWTAELIVNEFKIK
ncbi:MAG: C-GCAxxG-C-C family protein [Candidatus Thermoplasmatota archaeon]|nr:C-GCAxxG-C-C family protein [Candidatus Thermoplasmatota archaeon]MBU1940916.1 C-GCAxxG-C-C family protein [Candidatus Thermoplasmatota archaeon]